MADLAAGQAFELKSRFLRELTSGYSGARAACDALRASGVAERPHLDTLRRFFHKLAGTAPTVDLSVLGKLAGACETGIDAVIAGKFALGRYALQLIEDGLAGVASALEQTAQPPEYFKARLDQEMARAQRYHSKLVLGLIDIDGFKHINDAYGRAAGDAVLSKLSALFVSSLRASDVIARYAGDEFALMLIESSIEDCSRVCNRLRESVERTAFELPDTDGGAPRLNTTVCIGLAEYKPGETPHDLLLRVDGALYQARSKGHNRVVVAH
jgi:diguanylate cyclase (GGDEF)-like protein